MNDLERRSARPIVREGELVRETHTFAATAVESENVFDYLKIVWDRRVVVGGIWLAVTMTAVIYCFTATPLYQASAQIIIEPENPNVLAFKAVIEEETSKSDYYQTQYQLLRSRMLVRSTLDQLKLWSHQDFKARVDRGGTVAASLSNFLFGEALASPSEPPGPQESVPELQAIGRFLAHLTIEPVRGSRLLNVRFMGSDPRLCRDVVNTLVRAHIDRSLEFRSAASREASRWLDVRIAQQRKLVEASENALQQYLVEQNAGSAFERQTIVGQRLSELNAALIRAKSERIAREAMYQQLQILRSNPDGAELPVSTPAIEALRAERAGLRRKEAQMSEELGDRHPDLIAVRASVQDVDVRLGAEVQRYLDSVRKDVQADVLREQNLARELQDEKGRAMALEQKGIEYSVLQREADSNRQVFQSLLQRAKETAVSGELNTSNVRLVDPATLPLSTIAPRKRLILPLAALAGLGLGITTALLLAIRDDRIRSPEHIRRQLDLRFLGFAPVLPSRIVESGELQLDDPRTGEFAEALRVVRTNLSFCVRDQTPRVVLVTSSAHGEGKTMIAANLAVALAQAHQRVLVVDGDLRRPRLHDVFSCERQPGLSDYLADPISGKPVVQRTDVAGLSVMTAGTAVDSPSDLLGFSPAEQLVKGFGPDFDWIIIDTPPTEEVTDACLFAQSGARVLFVVAPKHTTGELARTSVARLATTEAEFAGAVLSRVHLRRNGSRRDWTERFQGS
jgi:capsular exopolysaccharide synthesis family protein